MFLKMLWGIITIYIYIFGLLFHIYGFDQMVGYI